MNQEDIIRMAREAGMEQIIAIHEDGTRTVELPDFALLERFAALVAAAEREACAEVCEEIPLDANPIALTHLPTIERCAAAIRARGEK